MIVHKISEQINVDVTHAIDKCHRVGKVKSGPSSIPRPIIVRFKTYETRQKILQNKRQLAKVDLRHILSDEWPSIPSSTSSASRRNPALRIFINEDLTRTRSEAAAFARDLKRRKTIEDTWTKDGVVYIKRGTTVQRSTTRSEIELLI